jgi:RND superfamily putative drug exporter
MERKSEEPASNAIEPAQNEETEPLVSPSEKSLNGKVEKKSMKGWSDSLLTWWFDKVKRFRIVFLVIWPILLGVCGFFSAKVFGSTVTTFQAPDNTYAHYARLAVQDKFPSVAHQDHLFVVIQRSGAEIDLDWLHDFSLFINTTMYEAPDAGKILNIQGFTLLNGTNYDMFKTGFLSTDGKISFLTINYDSETVTNLGLYLRTHVKDFVYSGSSSATSGLYIGTSGFDLFGLESRDTAETDLATVDVVAICITLFAFWLFLRNLRLVIIPFLSLITALPYSLAILYAFTSKLEITVVAPSIMLTMTLAFSTDYALFILTRYKEELEQKGRSVEDAVYHAMVYAGNIILTSGSVLFITFAFLMTYKSAFLVGIGLGITIVVIMTIFVNLTLTPSLLLTFPNFFSKPSLDKIREHGVERFNPEVQRQSKWYRWASQWETKWKAWLIIAAVLIFTIPGVVFLFYLKTTIDQNQIVPRDSEANHALNILKTMITNGKIAPYKVMLSLPDENNSTVFSEKYFNVTNDFVSYLDERKGLKVLTNVIALPYFFTTELSPSVSKLYMEPSDAYDTPTAEQYRYFQGDSVSDDQTAAEITIYVEFDPLTTESRPWIASMIGIMNDFSSNQTIKDTYGTVNLVLYSNVVELIDLADSIFDQFPYTIIANLVVLFVLVAVVYRSILIPLRATFTIALSVAWAYGLTVIVYQFIMGMDLYWLGPVMTFSITTGLGLDYDIFLISKIVEYMEQGFSTSAAITKGVSRTGTTITGAGVIMAVAFGGQLFSKIPFLNQYAMVLFCAVVLDTFVVRTAFVPAVLQLCGEYNWWPGIKPAERKGKHFKGNDESIDED